MENVISCQIAFFFPYIIWIKIRVGQRIQREVVVIRHNLLFIWLKLFFIYIMNKFSHSCQSANGVTFLCFLLQTFLSVTIFKVGYMFRYLYLFSSGQKALISSTKCISRFTCMQLDLPFVLVFMLFLSL